MPQSEVLEAQPRTRSKPWLQLVAGAMALSGIALGGWLLTFHAMKPSNRAPTVLAMAAPAVPALPKPSVLWIPSPNFDDRPAGSVIDTLVIHDTESPGVTKAQTIARIFANPRFDASAHYVIGKDGTIVQCVPDEKRAWHAGPSRFRGRYHVNDFAIGIELVNAQTGHDPFTAAQYRSLIALSAYLVQRYHIPLDHITGHRDVTLFPQYRQDPANNFDWQRLLHGVEAKIGDKERIAAPTRAWAQQA